jgi:hypothetical protein
MFQGLDIVWTPRASANRAQLNPGTPNGWTSLSQTYPQSPYAHRHLPPYPLSNVPKRSNKRATYTRASSRSSLAMISSATSTAAKSQLNQRLARAMVSPSKPATISWPSVLYPTRIVTIRAAPLVFSPRPSFSVPAKARRASLSSSIPRPYSRDPPRSAPRTSAARSRRPCLLWLTIFVCTLDTLRSRSTLRYIQGTTQKTPLHSLKKKQYVMYA